MAEYRALLEDTERKRRDKFRVTAAMLDSAAASVPADGDVVIVEGFGEPPNVVGRARDFGVERDGGTANLVCSATLDVEPDGRVLAPSVTVTGEQWQVRFLRLVREHKNPRARLERDHSAG